MNALLLVRSCNTFSTKLTSLKELAMYLKIPPCRTKASQRADNLQEMGPTIVSSRCICLMNITERGSCELLTIPQQCNTSPGAVFSHKLWLCTHENHKLKKDTEKQADI